MLPAKAIEVRHVQHKAIQHSNALSLGSHFNHSLFSATVPAGCKLCRAVINPCQVRRRRRRGKNERKRAEVWGAFDDSIPHPTPLSSTPHRHTHTHIRLRYIVLHSWRKSWTPKELWPSYSTFMFVKPAKALFVPLYSFFTIGQRQPSSGGGTKYMYLQKIIHAGLIYVTTI